MGTGPWQSWEYVRGRFPQAPSQQLQGHLWGLAIQRSRVSKSSLCFKVSLWEVSDLSCVSE
jgi:hypothetical protein